MPFHRPGGTAWLIPTTATNQDIKSYSANTCNVSPVIVGIDGSQAAIHAAELGGSRRPSAEVFRFLLLAICPEDDRRDVEPVEASLRAARVVVETTGRSVKVETEILRGRPAAILVSESEDAEMDWVGSTGIDRYISCAQAIGDLLTCDRRDMARWRPDRGPMALPPPAVSENSGSR